MLHNVNASGNSPYGRFRCFHLFVVSS
ncbi:hypothetical protein [Blautia luti]